MRAVGLVLAATAALGLASCDINTGPPKAAQADCHCAAPPPAVPPVEPAPPPTYRHHHRYAYSGHTSGHTYYWRREYSELSVDVYDYHSSSTRYTTGGGASYAGGGAYTGDAAYGGGHDGAGTGTAVYAGGGHDRLSVWHGYDQDCPDKR
jgi:hypothetical protein